MEINRIINEYIKSTRKKIERLLYLKEIGVYVDISGIFSEGKQGYIYITLYDNSDDEDFRFEEITFKSPLSHFEICEENIIDLIVSSTNTIEIEKNFNYNFYKNPKFRGIYVVEISTAPKQPIEEVMTFSEACSKWELGESTLRSRLSKTGFNEDISWRKSGKVGLISRESMRKIYGPINHEK